MGQDAVVLQLQTYYTTASNNNQTGPPRCRGLFLGIASPAVLCHKEPARASKAPY